MILHTDDGREIDTSRDLDAAERHILQKLLCYQAFVTSVEEFRQKKRAAYQAGWNDSGPIRESSLMAALAARLERDIDEA